MISLKNLCKTFHVGFRRRRVDAVRDLSLEVNQGEVFGLIGPNGAGKTTTIKMLTGLIKPTSGVMQMMGYDGFDRRCSRKLGYLPEISYYYESLTAVEILDFYAKLYGIRQNRSKLVNEWIERVGLGHARSKRLGQFSKGMLQRVGLAQALIGDPELVILDEPQSGLDPLGRRDVADLILECQKAGKTIFFSSHILPDVERLCDRIGVIRNGKMETVGTLHDLLAGDRHIDIRLHGTFNAQNWDHFLNKDGLSVEEKADVVRITLEPKATDMVNDILAHAIAEQMNVEHVMERGMDLEELFTQMQKNSESQTDSDSSDHHEDSSCG